MAGQLTSRKRKQVATVALANKMARMAWAVLFKGRRLSPADSSTSDRSLDGLHMTPGKKRQAWKSLRDSHICRPTTTTDLSFEIPARFAGRRA